MSLRSRIEAVVFDYDCVLTNPVSTPRPRPPSSTTLSQVSSDPQTVGMHSGHHLAAASTRGALSRLIPGLRPPTREQGVEA
jgi:hypothetical protein